LPVESDRILASDLAAALPAFRALPPDTILGTAPQPGSDRFFRAPELTALAHHHSIHLENPSDVCFAWPMEPLSASRVMEAMRAALALPDARIEIAEISSYPVPRGRLEFSRDRLTAPPEADRRSPVLWRGEVIYGEDRRYTVWARVRIAVRCTRVVAAEPLRAGRPIEARQVRAESAACFLAPEKTASATDEVVGRKLLRPVAAGNPVPREWLVEPNDINRGDLIQIEVRSGAARLAFTGKAESAGRAGDLISVLNPSSKKVFQARVDGKGKAVVLAGSAAPAISSKVE
jgi:flagella basal body P-ring formation protein FlgA